MNQIVWCVTEREWSTFFEASINGFEVWLEWNPRVFAYRYGFVTPDGVRAPNTLGYAGDENEARALLMVALEQFQNAGV